MKKNLYLLCLLLACISVNAQNSKHYIYAFVDGPNGCARLSGDIPSSLKDTYYGSDFDKSVRYYNWVGDLLNKLAENGFEVEKMNSTDDSHFFFLLAKSSNSSGNIDLDDGLTRIKNRSTEEVVEVARYNLQGLPVKETEKGIQIVVYSNYTTKTVIVE